MVRKNKNTYLCRPENEGLVVQLVRMPPCHGGGRGFESRPVRKKVVQKTAFFVMPYYVYVLANTTDDELYKGFSENPEQRLRQHNEAQTKFTATKKNWTIIGLFLFDTKKEALVFERKIKKWNRRSLDKLIASQENLAAGFNGL